MAFSPVAPVTANMQMTQAKIQRFIFGPVLDLTGSPVDFSGWDSFVANAVPPVPALTGASSTFATVTGDASGFLTLTTGASDLASKPPGSARLVISGKPTSGDTSQLLASGALTVLAA